MSSGLADIVNTIAANEGMSVYTLLTQTGLIGPVKESTSGDNKRKYTIVRPDADPTMLRLGTHMIDSTGRMHEVVIRKAFRGTRQAWKIVKAKMPVPVTSSAVSMDVVLTRPPQQPVGLVEYDSEPEDSDSDSEPEDSCPHTVGLVEYDSEPEDSNPESNDNHAEMDTQCRRKYNSSKPVIDPRTVGVGAVIDSGNKRWIVAEVKTRGDGKRLLWKLNPRPVPEQNDTQMSDNGMHDSDTSPKEVVSKKPRPGPITPAKTAVLNETQIGVDGRSYICVERTRQNKSGTETTFQVWQKTKAA